MENGASDQDRHPLLQSDQAQEVTSPPQTQLLLIASEFDIPLCIGICHAQDRCTSPQPMQADLYGR